MTYSPDLRSRVVDFIKNGGTKTEASRRFDVSRSSVHAWIKRETLHPKTYTRSKFRKLDENKLKDHVRAHPQMRSDERAAHFGVHPSNICRALQRLRISRKKHN